MVQSGVGHATGIAIPNDVASATVLMRGYSARDTTPLDVGPVVGLGLAGATRRQSRIGVLEIGADGR